MNILCDDKVAVLIQILQFSFAIQCTYLYGRRHEMDGHLWSTGFYIEYNLEVAILQLGRPAAATASATLTNAA